VISTILFDVDGVLVVGDPFSVTLARDHHITLEMTAPFFRYGPFEQCLIGKADLKAEIASHLSEWGWRGSVEAFLDLWFTSSQQVDAPLLAAAQRLRQQGIRCYLATNQERYRAGYLLTQMGLAAQFDGCFASAHIGCLKEHPDFFRTVLRAIPNVQASDILFWDGSPANVAAARAAGLRAEVYTTFASFEQQMRLYL
jgi:putative hydrolase of the HAD superfamily